MVLIEVAFAITLRNIRRIIINDLSIKSAITLRNIRRIIINDLSIKSVKAFPTTFQLCCHLTLFSHI